MTLSTPFQQHIDILLQRHIQAMENAAYNKILIHAGTPKYAFLDDNSYPFKPNPHFKHWVPLTAHPHCFVVVSANTKPQLIYFQPADYWHQVPADPSGFWVDAFDITLVSTEEDIRRALPANLSDAAYIGEDAAQLTHWHIGHINPPALINQLHYQRAYKTAYEMSCLREANRIGARAHIAARDTFLAGGSEFDIHLAYLKSAQSMECELPYGNIIAINEHGATLHYHGSDKTAPQDTHSLVIDAGVGFRGYASDITRSYAYHDGEYAALIAALDREQRAILNEIKPGKDFAQLHWSAHHRIAHILQQFDLVRLSPEAMVEQDVTRCFFPCGLGHFIGLQVHDVDGYLKSPEGEYYPRDEKAPFLRLVRPIEKDQVVTIEPGIYFIEQLLQELSETPLRNEVNWEKIATFKRYGGVRIEDCVAINETGIENFTRDAFAEID